MATARIYCTEAKRWNWQFGVWQNFTASWGSYSNLGMVGYIPEYTDGASVAGVCMLSFDALPEDAIISSAVLKVKSVRYSGSGTHTVKLRVSDTYQAYDTSEPSGYQSVSIPFTTTLTEREIDITSQMQSYAVAGVACYLYAYESNPSSSDYNNDYIQGIADSTPYIDIEYTLAADTVGRYDGSSYEDCEAYVYDASGFVQCEAYRYNGSEFEPCSTT